MWMRANAYPERGQVGIGRGGLIPSLSLGKNAVGKEGKKKKKKKQEQTRLVEQAQIKMRKDVVFQNGGEV
jgi:hypothetical protein